VGGGARPAPVQDREAIRGRPERANAIVVIGLAPFTYWRTWWCSTVTGARRPCQRNRHRYQARVALVAHIG
jgi:hypothetical protein